MVSWPPYLAALPGQVFEGQTYRGLGLGPFDPGPHWSLSCIRSKSLWTARIPSPLGFQDSRGVSETGGGVTVQPVDWTSVSLP